MIFFMKHAFFVCGTFNIGIIYNDSAWSIVFAIFFETIWSFSYDSA